MISQNLVGGVQSKEGKSLGSLFPPFWSFPSYNLLPYYVKSCSSYGISRGYQRDHLEMLGCKPPHGVSQGTVYEALPNTSFTQSFNRYLLNDFHVPEVEGTGLRAGNKSPCLPGVTIPQELANKERAPQQVASQ